MAALGGVSFAQAQTAPNSAQSFGVTSAALSGLNVGSLPPDVVNVIDALNGYLAVEQGINENLVIDREIAQTAVTDQQAAISAQTTLINQLIAADPLDPQIAAEQGVLANLQNDLVTLQ